MKKMAEQLDGNLNECTFCSARMFRTGAYTGDNGETVYVDYIQDLDRYCKEHCNNYKRSK